MPASRWLRSGVLALAALFAATSSRADDYPVRPIHVIVPFAPGGATDFAIRLIQQDLAQALGQPIVIDNRGGAAGTVGTELAAQAAPDGYTLLFGNVGTISINPHFFPELKVKPERDFIPISLVSETPGIVIASKKFPPNSLKEMVAYAKAHPGKINYAASGISTLNTLAMEEFRHAAGLEMTQIPYKGGAGPAILDLIAGNVDVMLVTLSAAAAHVKAGQLKAIAITTKERVALLPDVPTLAESGYPEEVSSSWQGLFAVKDTPQSIVAKLHAAVVKAVTPPNVRRLMSEAGTLATASASPEEFKTYLAADQKKWAAVVDRVKAEESGKPVR